MSLKFKEINAIKVAPIFLLLLLCSCGPNIILKTSYYSGTDKKPTRFYEYNLKSKKLTKIDNKITAVQIFKLKNADRKFIKKSLNNVGIDNNFCWISNSTSPKYYYKYEIILGEKSESENCVSTPIKYEIFEAFHTIKDTIRKRVN